ncbi:hypothetical protein QIU18_00590 [Capnocytophaga canimorsus]|nr:hypothetical protein [Capnocytophaga canimorsus]WGU68211.1 hypothetical protein QIU19_13240 [Capnocytophaga canimorsus]WGU70687.1 hypothetical protein QIU18_00590 [Capnocytophaga canimorsus]
MIAKVEKTLETSKFSVEKGKLCCNGKTYAECNFDEKQNFNEALSHDNEERIVAMLRRATMPLTYAYRRSLNDTPIYENEPHFI